MPPFAWVVLIAAVVAAVLISRTPRTAQAMKQRPGELRDVARALSFEYRELDEDGADDERLVEPAMKEALAWEWASTLRQPVARLLIGTRDGFTVWLFDLWWKAPGAGPRFQTVLLCQSTPSVSPAADARRFAR